MTGVITLAASPNRELTPVHYFTVLARDGGSPPQTGSASVTVKLGDVNDNVPTFKFPSGLNSSLVVANNHPPGYVIKCVEAVDPDGTAAEPSTAAALGVFGRYLTLWVALAIVVGVAVGQWLPAVPDTLSRYEYANVSVPVALLIWAMIFPMMVQIDFGSIVGVRREPKGLVVTTAVNWLIKPFSMFAIAWFFLLVVFSPFIDEPLAREYLAGAILLGAAPCTAMVFVWSLLTRGDPAYTLVQVAVNDLIMLVAFAPIIVLLLDVSDISVPWDTVGLSVVLYIVIPLAAGYGTRLWLLRRKGSVWFDDVFMKRVGVVTPTGLILTLVLLFAFQGDVILDSPVHIVLIAVPLTIQTVLIFFVAYRWMRAWDIRHAVAAPGALIGASNFFELAVAAAIALFGLQSGAALATVVGVLVEVPLMLALVRYANRTRHRFPAVTSVALRQSP
jgi:ACR3 family arsenite transporter